MKNRKTKNKPNNLKLKTKQYTISAIFSVFTRQFIYLLVSLFVSLNVGLLIFALSKTHNYSSSVSIDYEIKLDDYQPQRIANYLVCNESIDKYVEVLAFSNIKDGNEYFTFSSLSDALTSSYVINEDKTSTYTLNLSCKTPNVSHKALQVIAKKACSELYSIYKNTFYIDADSYTSEIMATKRNKSVIFTSLAIGFIVGFAAMFIIDGFDDSVYDRDDVFRLSDNVVFVKKTKKQLTQNHFLNNTNYVVLDSDFEGISELLTKRFPSLGSFHISKLNEILTNEQTKNFTVIVIRGKSSYSSFYEFTDTLLKKNINVEKIIILDCRFFKEKNVQK